MEYLLKQKLFEDIDITTESGRTPSHHAAFLGSLKCCRLLIQHGANFAIRDRNNKLPFDYALENNYDEVVKLLLQSSGFNLPKSLSQDDTDRGRSLSSRRQIELDRRHLFEQLILAGELEKCKGVVSNDLPVDIMLPSCGKCTPLFAAIRSGKENVIQWLLEKGAKPTNVFCDYNTHEEEEVVTFASSSLQCRACLGRILTSARQHPTLWSMSLTRAIYETVNRGEVEMLSQILEDLNSHLETYYNAWEGNTDMESETLSALDFGPVFVNGLVSLDSSEDTSLNCAARKGDAEIVHMLVRQGAKIDSRDSFGRTPLIDAAREGNSEIAEILIDYGASVDLRDNRGKTAMVYAVLCGNLKTARLLHKASSFAIKFMFVNGCNLLAQNTTREMFRYLISIGLDLEHLDRSGVAMAYFALGRSTTRQDIIHSRLKLPSAPNRPPKNYNPLAVAVCDESNSTIKQFYLALPPSAAAVLIDDEDFAFGSPCCNASAIGKLDTVKLLLALGANIEKEGSAFGTPLMCAIACGRLEVVKFLVRSGAELQYTSEDGSYRSGVMTSLPFPEVTRWLLVERFRDQQRLGNGVAELATDQIPWSGKRAMKVALRDWELRRWGESSLEFCTRLEKIKKGCKGRTVTGQILWDELGT